MKVVYRDKLGRFTKASKKTAKQFTYSDDWSLLDVADAYYTKQQVIKIKRLETATLKERIEKEIRGVSIRKPKPEKFRQAFFFTRNDNSDLFSFLSRQGLSEKLQKIANRKDHKNKVMVAEVITTIGDKKQERVVGREFKLTHLGKPLEFVSGKRKGKRYSMADHVAHFIHDSVNEYISDEQRQFSLYATETYGQRQRQQKQQRAKGQKKRIARTKQTFEIRIRFISKTASKSLPTTIISIDRASRRRAYRAKQRRRTKLH